MENLINNMPSKFFLLLFCSSIFLIALFTFIAIRKKNKEIEKKEQLERDLLWKDIQSKPRYYIAGFVKGSNGEKWMASSAFDPSNTWYSYLTSEQVAIRTAIESFSKGSILMQNQICSVDLFEMLEVVKEDKEPEYVL